MKDLIPQLSLVRTILSILFFLGVSWLNPIKAEKKVDQSDRPPNIVLFFVDDLGYGDLSSYGALGYTTPYLDQMAAEGTRFTNFLAAQAVCSASRAALLTGCYPNRIGITGALFPSSKIGLNPAEETLAELLQAKGYKTGIFGKWHLGHHAEFLPLQHGFDEFYGIPYSHDMWPLHPKQSKANYPPLFLLDGDKPSKEVKTLEDVSQLTALFTEKAVQFIDKHKEDPFFIYIPHPLPHIPLGASKDFAGKSEQGAYGDVIMELDWSVGRILSELKRQGLDTNTLVIFTSDNGPWINYGNHAGSSGGLREAKGSSFEGGQRVPCIMRWPGVIPAGQVNNKLLSTLDLLPTIADICGASQPLKPIDGVVATSLIKGKENQSPRKHFLYYYKKNNLEAVRKGNWKLVFPHPGRTYHAFPPGIDGKEGRTKTIDIQGALYDLSRDPGEQYDVYQDHPAIVKELELLAEEARNDLGDDLHQRAGKNRRAPGIIP